MMYRLAAAYTVYMAALRERAVGRLEMMCDADPEEGSSTETAIIVAALALVAVGVVTYIGRAVIAKAHSISLDTPNLNTAP